MIDGTRSRCRHCRRRIIWEQARLAWHTEWPQLFITCEKNAEGHVPTTQEVPV